MFVCVCETECVCECELESVCIWCTCMYVCEYIFILSFPVPESPPVSARHDEISPFTSQAREQKIASLRAYLTSLNNA